ncbi:hypothetical protein JZ751_014638 [Albula glossodonta]|uniref:Uncharacterized protein n=1 Tax=Albula glossodonta TaxID=121402 RepID=A0A8T2MZB1_9TELE|nr:hypothetical protein JZ751_014638 [Albula glossodonta]
MGANPLLQGVATCGRCEHLEEMKRKIPYARRPVERDRTASGRPGFCDSAVAAHCVRGVAGGGDLK